MAAANLNFEYSLKYEFIDDIFLLFCGLSGYSGHFCKILGQLRSRKIILISRVLRPDLLEFGYKREYTI